MGAFLIIPKAGAPTFVGAWPLVAPQPLAPLGLAAPLATRFLQSNGLTKRKPLRKK